jgi:tetratricopeptide (TPR) repeat protein
MRKLIYWIPILAAVALLAGSGSGCTARAKASYHLKRADRLFDSGQYESAEIEYENVLRSDPQNAKAWDRLGEIYFSEGRGPETMAVLLHAKQADAGNLDVRLKLATLYLAYGHSKDAANEAVFVLSQNPRDELAPLLLAKAASTNEISATRLRLQELQRNGNTASLETALGILALRQYDSKTASNSFQRAVALNPNFSEAYTGLGGVFYAQKDLKRADRAFKTAARLAPVWSGDGVRYAQFKILAGDNAGATQLLQDMIAKAPLYMPARTALAQLSVLENDRSNAMTLVAGVLNRDPHNFDGLLLQGRLELLQGRTADAVADYQMLSAIYPDTPSVLYVLAQAYLANNQTNEANATLTRVLDLKPDFADAVLLRAQTEIAHGNPALAIVSLNQLIRRQPHLPQALVLLAEAYRAQGAPDNSIEIYQELENSYPDNAQVPVLLGDLLFQQNQRNAARAEFQKALRIQPEYLPAVEQLVELDLAERQYAAALQRVQQLVVRDPNLAVSQLLLGTTLAAEGETNQAESALIKAIKLQPDSQAAYLLLAQLYLGVGQSQKALAQLQIALDKDPNDLTAVMLKGIIYNSQEDYADARDVYEKLLGIEPDSSVALNNLACIYADHLNQLDKAYPLARRASEITPSDPRIADTLGWILFRRGEYTPALVALRESAATLDSIPVVQYHFGMACYMAGYESDAIKAFGRALQLNGDFAEKGDCRQRLAILSIDSKQAGADTCAWLEKWTANYPNDPVALARLAAIYQSKGMADKARTSDLAILKFNPQNVFALANLAQLYSSADPQKACAFAKSAYDVSPGDPEIAHLYGRLAFQTGDYAWALTLLQLAAQAQPKNPDVLFDLGQALYSQGKVSDAQIFAQKALQSDANFARADDARHFLVMTAMANNVARASAAQVDQILNASPGYVPALMVKAALAVRNSDTATARQTYTQVLKIYPNFAPAQKELALLDAKRRP